MNEVILSLWLNLCSVYAFCQGQSVLNWAYKASIITIPFLRITLIKKTISRRISLIQIRMQACQIFALRGEVSQTSKQQIFEHFMSPTNQFDFINVMVMQPRFFFFELLPRTKSINMIKFELKNLREIKKNLRKPKHIQKFMQIPLLKHISHINFQFMRIIQLQYAKITSLQPLTYMNMPVIESLNLAGNDVTCLKPIAKIYFRRLNHASLRSNKFLDEEFRHFARLFVGQNCPWLRLFQDSHGVFHRIRVWFFKTINKMDIDYIDMSHHQWQIKLKAAIHRKLNWHQQQR